MPISLDTMTVQTVDDTAKGKGKVFSPKFFDNTILTGVGKKSGNLCEARNPQYIASSVTTKDININTPKRSYTNGLTQVSLIPVNPLLANAWNTMYEYNREVSQLTKIGEHKAANGNVLHELYIEMIPHSIIYEDTAPALNQGGGPQSHIKKMQVCYQLFLYHHNVQQPIDGVYLCENVLPNNKKRGQTYEFEFTCNPMAYLMNRLNSLQSKYNNLDTQAIDNYIINYSLYAHMQDLVEIWQTTIDTYIDQFCYNVAQNFGSQRPLMNYVSDEFHFISSYDVPLDLYKNIYQSVTKHFSPDDATILCKQNLNLLLSDRLNNINANKNSFTCIPSATSTMNLSRFSPEQIQAITSTEPLILVQAGAGTGKSTVILGRVDYMLSTGVNPQDITVLSFTNAAADNITDRNPDIHSMTIARMVHEIYTLNFPDHELSSIDTIMNAIEIYYDRTHPMYNRAIDFKRHLRAIKTNDNESFTNMNNFVEKHYDEIVQILNNIKQTCLEMEIIICYQKIDTLAEPAEIQSKYLIIDEVQDNSIFEFIYTLKYIDKHQESLFIVGDCSQTLYEFRASNPKALNVLEGSGVFKTFQLQINYRSNQEILDFANVALSDIEANQYAHIQLHANSRAQVTEQSFTNAVHFYYHQLAKIADFDDALPSMFALDLKAYIDDCLARGEQIAFLAYSRRNCNQMREILEKMYPQSTCATLIPQKMYNDTIFSDYILRYWAQAQFMPTANITSVIQQDIYAKAQYFVAGDVSKKMPSIQKLVSAWRADVDMDVQSWYAQYQGKIITQDEFLLLIRDSMMNYEIQSNAIKQSLLASRNKAQKLSDDNKNANFLLSTIHSAKGLEFDNVVVLYRNEQSLKEDKKRMYYVAFTRAMKSEFILAYDTAKCPAIEGNYKMLVKAYHEKDAAIAAAVAAGAPLPADTTSPINFAQQEDTEDEEEE